MFSSDKSTKTVSLIIRWLLLSLAVWIAAELIEGIHLEGWKSILIVAAILGLLNLYLRPVLVLISLPITIVTLGLFIVVINAILLGITNLIADLVDFIDFEVDSLGAALLGALVISIVSLLLSQLIHPDRLAFDLTHRRSRF